MADFEDGEKGQVSGMSYCMGDSIEARNNKAVNSMSGYHDMADLANVGSIPVSMKGEKANKQNPPEAANNKYNYDRNRS